MSSTSRNISNNNNNNSSTTDEESLILDTTTRRREATTTTTMMTAVGGYHHHYYYGAVDESIGGGVCGEPQSSSSIGNGNGNGGGDNRDDGDDDDNAADAADGDAEDTHSSYDNQQHQSQNKNQNQDQNQNHLNLCCHKRYFSKVSVSTSPPSPSSSSTTTTPSTAGSTTSSASTPPPPLSSKSKSSKAIGSSGRSRSSSSSHRILRLVLIILMMACCYIGFYAVFALWTHHNHPDGVFGEEPNDYINKNKNNNISNNNNNPPPTKFLFGNIGSALLGWPSSSQPPQPNQRLSSSNPTPRSILLMLHAEAVPANDFVMLDEDRPLTATGMQQSERLGSYLAEHQIAPPDWIFCSPSVRTSYTLELVRRHWASNVPVAFENILYVLAFNDYFAFVAGLNRNFRRVLIVGHNPAILNTAKKLMREHGLEDFPLAGFLEISWDDQQFWFNMYPGTGEISVAISGGGSDDGFFEAM